MPARRIDDACWLAYSEVLPDERKEAATGFLERALAWFAVSGVAVERVMTDNGNCYRSRMFRQAAPVIGCAIYEPDRIPRAPMAKPNASSQPACASGPMPGPMSVRSGAAQA